MSQSNVIAGFLALAFIVFITMRGELPIYLGLLLADPKYSGFKPVEATTKTASLNITASDIFKVLPLIL